VIAAYVAAVNEAVDHINTGDNFSRYRAYIAEGAAGRIAPEELNLLFYRYVHATPFDERRFDETYAWMRSWGLAKGDKTFQTAVNLAWVGQ
jgi:NitT/TauT family transport system substrate-binding protein